jgi:hypothetical protein
MVMSRKRIAAHNTFTMLTADEQVYSHVPDFCWLDETGVISDRLETVLEREIH